MTTGARVTGKPAERRSRSPFESHTQLVATPEESFFADLAHLFDQKDGSPAASPAPVAVEARPSLHAVRPPRPRGPAAVLPPLPSWHAVRPPLPHGPAAVLPPPLPPARAPPRPAPPPPPPARATQSAVAAPRPRRGFTQAAWLVAGVCVGVALPKPSVGRDVPAVAMLGVGRAAIARTVIVAAKAPSTAGAPEAQAVAAAPAPRPRGCARRPAAPSGTTDPRVASDPPASLPRAGSHRLFGLEN